MTNIISQDDVFDSIWSIYDSNGNPVNITVFNGSASGPIVYRNEIKNILDFNKQLSTEDMYLNIINRISTIRYYNNNNYVIKIDGETVSSKYTVDRLLNNYKIHVDNILSGTVGTKNIENSILTSLSATHKKNKLNRSFNKKLAAITKVGNEADDEASKALFAPEDLALQIGWLSFGSENSGPDNIRLGPDNISIVDFNNVEQTSTIRSDTDIAIKTSNGQLGIEVDLIFPNVRSINGTIVDERGNTKGAAGFRDLFALLRMAPMVPVGGKAINMALVNHITSSGLYNELRRLYFENKINDEKLFEDAHELLGDQFKIGFNALSQLIRDERSTYDLLKNLLKKETEKNNIKLQDPAQKVDKKDLVDSLSNHGVLLSLVCTNIAVSTISSAVGAIRVRLSFQKYHSPYEDGRGLMFVDEDGNPTYNISKCYPLKKAVRSVFLSPKRAFLTSKSNLQYNFNEHYIPTIGDETKYNTKHLSGFDTEEVERKYRVNEEGFTEYKTVEQDNLLPEASKYSPVLFRFSPPSSTNKIYEYSPSDMILRNVSWTYQNKIATFPIEGQIYPGFQYMGRSTVIGNLTFTTNSKEAVQKFYTLKSLVDQHAKNETVSNLLRREFLDIYNDILLLSGTTRWIISVVKFSTIPDNPNLYEISIEIMSNMESVHKREKLKFETKRPSLATVIKFWDYLYDGLLAAYRKVSPNQNIGEREGAAKYSDAEIDNIIKLVFGTNKNNEYSEGILERNIFLAAILNQIKRGKAYTDAYNVSDIFPEEFKLNPNNPLGDLNNVGSFFAKIFELSQAGNKSISDQALKLNNGEESQDLVDIGNVFERLADFYEKKSENNLNNPFAISPWFISTSSSAQHKILETVAENLNVGGFFGYPTNIKDKLMSPNRFIPGSSFSWIPTRELWNSVWRVIGPDFKSQKDENGLAYKIQDSNGPDNRVFQISQAFKTMRGQMEEIVSNAEYRSYFPSFWNNIGRSADDFVDTLSLHNVKQFDNSKYLIDVDQFELNNNYIDLPMPKYFEVFGEDLKDGKPPAPRLFNGQEVWRKVAPTFLELGVKPDIYSSLSTLINNDTISPEIPELMTPRSFFDYCDPGFFYSKKSWLVEEYYNLLNNIDLNGGRDGFDLSSEDKYELEALDGSREIIIDRIDIRSMTKPSETIQKIGSRTVGAREIDRGKITELIADQISQDLVDKLSFPTIAKNNDISKLEELARQAGNISTKDGVRGKVHIIDATGRRVGAIVANQGTTSGNMVELKKISDIAQLKERIPKDIKFYFIDLTDQAYMAKNPNQVVYRDHQGVMQQNIYKAGDIKKLYKDTLGNIGDLTANYLRAYPTFKLYFVKEKVKDDILITTLEDDMYGYSSVIDINITIDKEDAPVARITLTDIAGNLSYAEFTSDQYSITDESSTDRDTITDELDYKSPDRIKLDVGTNIVIKMGYGNNPDTLKTVFTGAIAEIEPGAITTIVAQGYKSELFRQVNLYTGRSFSEHLLKQLIEKKDISAVNPNALIYKILESLASTPTLSLHASAGGIPHLGHYISFNDYIKASNTIKEYFTDSYQKTRDENLKSNDVLNSSNLVGGTSIVSGLLLAKFGSKKLGITAIGAGIADIGFGGSNNLRNFIQRYSDEFMHTNVMRNVFITNDATKDGFFNTLFQSWIADGDGWNCLKEVSRYKIGYITEVVPYGNAATLFVGKPEQPYHYKPITNRELAKFSLAQPFGQRIVFNKAFDNVIAKFLSSEEYGSRNISGKLSIDNNGFINGWSTSNTSGQIISIDDYIAKGIEYINITANKYNPPKPIDAVLLNRAFLQISSNTALKELGSYSVCRYILGKLNNLKAIRPADQPQYAKFDNKALSNLFKIDLNEDDPLDRKSLINVNFKESPDETIIIIKKSSIDYRQYLRNLSKKDVFVTESTLYEKGYNDDDQYWGLRLDGTSVSRHELFEDYRINPLTGKPRYSIKSQSADYINYRGLESQHIDITPFHNNFVFATKIGIGRVRGTNLTFANSNDEYVKESNTINTKDFTLYCDATSDLENIKKYGPHMIKLLFATFFGLMWTKDGDNVKLFAIEQDQVLDSLAEKYTEALLRGITLGDTEEAGSILYYKSIADPITGILGNLVGHPTLNKYKDVRGEPRSIDPETLGLVNTILESELKNMVLSGKIRQDQIDTVKNRFKMFIQLASLGNLTAKYINGVANTDEIVQRALQFGTQTFVSDSISDFDLINYNITNAIDNLDSVSRAAISKLIGLPTNVPFDPLNVDHLISLRTKLNGLNLSDNTINNLSLSQSERDALTTLLKDKDRNNKLNLDTITSIEDINNTQAIALGLNDNKTLYQILVENADYYKAFLIFFSKWLQNNFTDDKSLVDHRVNSAILNKLGDKYEPGIKRFEDVHYIVSGFDIIENNITTTMSQMANNILLTTPTEIEVTAQNDENAPEPIWKVDEYKTKYIPYPNYQYSGVDWNPYVRPELRKQRVVVERNARTDEQRLALLINHMAEAIRPMYRGHLKIIGRAIKPYDKIVLFDATNEIFGLIEVEHVMHSFDANNGWTTTIVPCAYVNPMEPGAGLQKAFDTSNITTMLKVLKVFDWALDIMFWGGIILAPFTAGASTTASAGAATISAGVKQSVKASVMQTLKSWFGKQTKAALGAGAKAGTAALNKVAGQYSQGMINLLKNIRSGITSNIGPLNWKALGTAAADSFVGSRSLQFLAANGVSDAIKLGAKMVLNVHTDMTMKSGTLPVHTYCLTRFGRPIQSGLDMQKTTWYSFSERVEFNAKSASDKILQFINDATVFKTDDTNALQTIYTNLEDR